MIGLNKGFLQCDIKKKCQTPAYANEKIEELDTRRQKITKAIADLSVETISQQRIDLLSGYLDDWENISFEDKRKAMSAWKRKADIS